MYFVIAGPLIGVLVSVAIIVALVLFDPRIKFVEQLNAIFPDIVLATIPATEKNYQNWALISISVFAILATYSAAALTFQYI